MMTNAAAIREVLAREDFPQVPQVPRVPDEDRGRLMTVCIKCLPAKIDFVDGEILVYILSQIRLVNLHDEDLNIDFQEHSNMANKRTLWWWFAMDGNGRITELQIEVYGSWRPFDLPAIIVRLGKLNHLDVRRCRSLPAKELSRLTHLNHLTLNRCSDLLENFPIDMNLNKLFSLTVSNCEFQSASSPFLKWMVEKLPSLIGLHLWAMGENETDCILNRLCTTTDVCFQDSLKVLCIHNSNIDDNRLETLLYEVSPSFQNLRCFDLTDNKIESVQPIVDKLKLKIDQPRVVSKSLRRLILDNNPISKKMKESPDEKAALLSFLEIFYTIHDMGPNDIYGSDVEYALRINHAGRRIFGGDGSIEYIPLSLWPTILRKASEKSKYIRGRINEKKIPTGLFFLLQQHGSVLVAGTDLITSTMGCENNDEDEDDMNDNGNEKRHQVEGPALSPTAKRVHRE